jgi:galactonate dehydratase
VGVVPHNPLSPVLLATCLQVSAVTHGVPILEHTGEVPAEVAQGIHGPPPPVRGYLDVPTAPGLGAMVVRESGQPLGYDRAPLVNSDGSLRDY